MRIQKFTISRDRDWPKMREESLFSARRARQGWSPSRRGKKLQTYTFLNWCLLIFRALIFESRVDCGNPEFGCSSPGAGHPAIALPCCLDHLSLVLPASQREAESRESLPAECPTSQLSSMEMFSESQMMTERSITFCNSLMLPGHR